MSEPTIGQLCELHQQIRLGIITRELLTEWLNEAKKRSLTILIKDLFDWVHSFEKDSEIDVRSLARLGLVKLFTGLRDIAKAREIASSIERSLHSYPNHAWLIIAQVTKEKPDIDKAREGMSEALYEYMDVRFFIELAELTEEKEDIDRALRVARKRIFEKGLSEYSLVAGLVRCLVKTNKIEKARKFAEELPRVSFQSLAFADIAELTGDKRDFDRAREKAESSLIRDADVQAMCRVAEVAKDVKDIDHVLTEAKIRGCLKPIALDEVAFSLVKMGLIDRARTFVGQMENSDNDCGDTWLAIAQATKEKPDIDKARENLEKYCSRSSPTITVHNFIAIAALSGDRRDIHKALAVGRQIDRCSYFARIEYLIEILEVLIKQKE